MAKNVWYLADGTGVGGNLGPELSGFLGHRSGDSGSLHLSLGVDDDTSVILEVQEGSIASAPGFALADNDSCVNCKLDAEPYSSSSAQAFLFLQ